MWRTLMVLSLVLSGKAPRKAAPRRRPAFCRPLAEVLEDRLVPSTFLVTNTLDHGSTGSLRWAITQANADTDPISTIDCNIIGSGVQTIQVGSSSDYPGQSLPTITHPVMLDGTSQPGYTGSPLIVLSGASAGSSGVGLTITAGNSTVAGLVINQFGGDGIDLTTNGGGRGGASQCDGERAGIAACQSAGVHAVERAGGSAALAGRRHKPICAAVAGAGRIDGPRRGRYELTTGRRKARWRVRARRCDGPGKRERIQTELSRALVQVALSTDFFRRFVIASRLTLRTVRRKAGYNGRVPPPFHDPFGVVLRSESLASSISRAISLVEGQHDTRPGLQKSYPSCPNRD